MENHRFKWFRIKSDGFKNIKTKGNPIYRLTSVSSSDNNWKSDSQREEIAEHNFITSAVLVILNNLKASSPVKMKWKNHINYNDYEFLDAKTTFYWFDKSSTFFRIWGCSGLLQAEKLCGCKIMQGFKY